MKEALIKIYRSYFEINQQLNQYEDWSFLAYSIFILYNCCSLVLALGFLIAGSWLNFCVVVYVFYQFIGWDNALNKIARKTYKNIVSLLDKFVKEAREAIKEAEKTK